MMKNERRIRAGLCRDFERITKLWKLSDADRLRILNMTSVNRFNAFCSGTVYVPNDVLQRILGVVQIHATLRVLFSGNETAVNGWVHRPNKAKICKGKPALDLLSSGNLKDLEMVADYLLGEALR